MINKFIFIGIRRLVLPVSIRNLFTMYRAIPYLKSGIISLWNRQLDVELLDGISIGASIAVKDYSTASSVIGLLGLGSMLENWTRKRSVDELSKYLAIGSDQVWIDNGDSQYLESVENVQIGDKIVVRTSEYIMFDSQVIEGDVVVNQASLTGESTPVAKHVGSTLFAGTIVEQGSCIYEVKQLARESKYHRILEMLENSESLNSKSTKKAISVSNQLVPYTLLGSFLTYAITRNYAKALSVLMVDFSCALKLAMPLALISAMKEARINKIIVKGGTYLEQLQNIDICVFDKTGTLTYANPKVIEVIPFGNHDEDEMLRLAACLEEHFPHSMANAVVQAAKDKNLDHDEFHQEVEYIVVHGIASKVDDKKVVIGSVHFIFEDEGCVVKEEDKEKFEKLSLEYSHLYMAIGDQLVAVICIFGPVRSEAKEVISALKEVGVKKIVMLTGDSNATAKSVAKEIGVDEYFAQVLPEQKAQYIDKQRSEGKVVMMVGDGVNDAPALSKANVGIAISDGSNIAKEVADITLSGESLQELILLQTISKNLNKRINNTYHFVISFNTALILGGILGVLTPATGALLHNSSTIGISLRNMTKTIKN